MAGRTIAAATLSPGRLVVVERFNWIGADAALACALSRGGGYAAYTVMQEYDRFTYAVDGELVLDHRDLEDDWLQQPALPGGVGPSGFDGCVADEYTVYSGVRGCALALLEYLTGVTFKDDHALFETPRPTYRRLQ